MRSVYGDECPKHPELAGRRYLPNKVCIRCHNDAMKVQHTNRKAIQQARDERLALLEVEVLELRNLKAGSIPELPALRAEVVKWRMEALRHELNAARAERELEELRK